jgi:hypothetical protein
MAFMAAPPIGLLAGAGQFPVVFAQKARELGHRVCCVGLKHLATDDLRHDVEEFHVVGLGRMGRVMRTFRAAGVKQIVMAGKIYKDILLSPRRLFALVPDWTALRFWYFRDRGDNRDDREDGAGLGEVRSHPRQVGLERRAVVGQPLAPA